MARSSYIYVLTNQGGEAPAHAFTVKHELISHMRRYEEGLPGRNVVRLPDGQLAGSVWQWVATEYLAEHG